MAKLLILFAAIITAGKTLINPYGPTIVSEYTNCLNELIVQNFEDGGLLYFSHTKLMSTSVARIRAELLRSIHGLNKYHVQVGSPTDKKAICVQDDDDIEEGKLANRDVYKAVPVANYFVIVIDTYRDFTHVASKIVRSRIWNPRAKFLILLFNFAPKPEINILHVERILQCLFKSNVINAVVVVPETNNIRNGLVYGWRPLDPPKYCGYLNETSKGRLLLENKCERGHLHKKNILFEDNLPLDMKGCHIHILALEREPYVSKDPTHPNVEREFIYELISEYNFTVDFEVLNVSRGEVTEEEKWDGALNDIIEKKGDLLLGGIFPDDEVHRVFECSYVYFADSYTWVVPRAEHSPAWLAIIITFDNLVWYSVLVGFVVGVLSWMVLGNLSHDSTYQKAFDHCFMNALVSNLGWCAYARPVKQSLRVFFGFFSLYCIVFVTAYQTKLIDVLTNPSFEYQIQTVEEIIDSGIKFGGYEILHDLFENSSDPFDRYIGDEWIDIEDVNRAMVDVVVHKNFSLLCSRLELKFLTAYIPELTDSLGNAKYYALPENVFTVPVEMVALQGYPYIEEFSQMLARYKAMGVQIGVKHRFEALVMRRSADLLHQLEDANPDVRALSMVHLQGGFLALALGYVVGTVVFLIELSTKIDCVREFKKSLKNKYLIFQKRFQ